MPYHYTEIIRAAYRGEMAHQHVTAISQFHRIQASPGYRAAAGYVAARLAAAGLETGIRSYPADGRARFWTTPSFLEWSCESASLHLLGGDGRPARLLCDFDAIPTSLIQRSVSVDGEFEILAPSGSGGKSTDDYAGLDVRGKLVLTGQPPSLVSPIAVGQLGAAGILFDGMKAGGRNEFDLPEARQYTSFWWGGETQPDAWGFVLSPQQGRELRVRLAKGERLCASARVDARFYEGAFEVVEAFIPGEMSAEVLLVSHLCHPKPGANDNASGAAALLETAVALQTLIGRGDLPRPQRGIRFIWPPEMTGTFAYLQERAAGPDGLSPIIAGLNLDMVGADQNQTGGVWEFVSLPWAGASFADHLLSALREPFLEGLRQRETAFSAGSDHYILSDPTVGIPAPMIIHWPDRFYHTSADTPEKVSPDSLARSGALAATYAYWLASAGDAEARWLGHRMVAAFAADAAAMSAGVVERMQHLAGPAERSAEWRRYRLTLDLKAACAAQGLTGLSRLGSAVLDILGGLEEAIEAAAVRERDWAEAETGPVANVVGETSTGWREEARGLTPTRLQPGPIDVALALQADHPHLLPAFRTLVEGVGVTYSDFAPVLQYWVDGKRSVADITDLAWLETGRAPDDAPLAFFKLLAEAGLVTLERA
jgi:aminopeptidase YwaD